MHSADRRRSTRRQTSRILKNLMVQQEPKFQRNKKQQEATTQPSPSFQDRRPNMIQKQASKSESLRRSSQRRKRPSETEVVNEPQDSGQKKLRRSPRFSRAQQSPQLQNDTIFKHAQVPKQGIGALGSHQLCLTLFRRSIKYSPTTKRDRYSSDSSHVFQFSAYTHS